MEDHLQMLGYSRGRTARDADLVVLNTCVVRKHAEDKVTSNLGYLKGIKRSRGMPIVVTGCFVGDNTEELRKLYPQVDFFFKPGELVEFVNWLNHLSPGALRESEKSKAVPNPAITAYIPIIQGCNNFCSYCIVPYRRGRERSRPLEEIVLEAEKLASRNVREITLLGQNVNAYGKDLGNNYDLCDLLAILNETKGLYRIRFLTNHPKDMSPRLIRAISSLNKVCHHICVPLQAGDDDILKAMNRHYTLGQYKELIQQIRQEIPDAALSTDIIVGFPDETEAQYLCTYNAIEEIRFDTVHVAAYSPRSETLAFDKYADNVPAEIKMQRLLKIEHLQESISGEINNNLIGTEMEILVEGEKNGKWYGRTYSDKLVFFKSDDNLSGRLVKVGIEKATPWSLQGSSAVRVSR